MGAGNYSSNVKGIRLAEIERRLDDLSRALASDGIRLACLFGSVLEGSPARDIDLAVLFREYRFDKYLEMLEAACRALGTRFDEFARQVHAYLRR